MKTEGPFGRVGYQYSNAKRYTVLLLDDEPDVTSVLEKGLETYAPFDVHAYNDAEEALKSLLLNKYDMMIIDIRLPKMNGFEFYKRAQELCGNVKVVFITASETYHDEYQKKYPQWNGNCFILKPISIGTLVKFLVSEISSRDEREPYN